MDSDGIGHGTESLMKINTQLLVKAFSNKASFISSNRTIEIFFNVKNPFFATMFCPRLKRTRDRVPF